VASQPARAIRHRHTAANQTRDTPFDIVPHARRYGGASDKRARL
jgi:hypothetical protein